MGMGLSICQTIIEEHRGRIELETGPEGTKFTLVVPLVHNPES